jgi:hypothetical protein
MRPLREYFVSNRGRAHWVLVGKGPSFAKRSRLLPGFVLGLNHVCQHISCDLAHFTDLDAYRQCEETLVGQYSTTEFDIHTGEKPQSFAISRGTNVVLPWHPHTNNKPGKRNLAVLLEEIPTLQILHEQGRLYSYNSTLAPVRTRNAALSTHLTRYFSAVVGLHILAAHGIKHIRTLGIDGGNSYAPCFNSDTLLNNGRKSFDVQFEEMRKIAEGFKLDLEPLVSDAAAS